MTNEERIADFLKGQRPQAYCDDCLSATLHIRPRQQVQQKTSSLCRFPGFARASGTCSKCRETRKVIKAT